MRYYFPNSTRVKKAAMRLADLLPEIPLSKWQAALSASLGYRNWHDFERHHQEAAPSILDEHLTETEFQSRMVDLCVSLATDTGLSDSDVQYAIQFSRLTGNRAFTFADHERIRCGCWRATSMPWKHPRAAGAVVSTAVAGRRRAYLRRDRTKGGTATCVTDTSVDSCFADFEVSSPRIRANDFVPMRLYVPYGFWKTKAGSTILFSRNYKPLWEIFENGYVKRVLPWKWINSIEAEDWFGGSKYAEPTWHENLKSGAGVGILGTYGIVGLPILADILPIIVNNNERSVDDALGVMKRSLPDNIAAE
jgi:hypothetical protein